MGIDGVGINSLSLKPIVDSMKSGTLTTGSMQKLLESGNLDPAATAFLNEMINNTPFRTQITKLSPFDGVADNEGKNNSEVTVKDLNVVKDNKYETLILIKDTNIGGLTYQAGTTVRFHELKDPIKDSVVADGQLAENQDIKIDDIKYQAGKAIIFHDDGKVHWGTLKEGQNIKGVNYEAGTAITFHNNGNVTIGTLQQGFSGAIDNVKYKAGEEIFFHDNGKVKLGKLAEDTSINVISQSENGKDESTTISVKFKANEWVYFHEDGKVQDGALAEKATIGGIVYKANTALGFNSNGTVKEGVLAENIKIGDKEYEANTTLGFNPNGTVNPHEKHQNSHWLR